MDWQVIYADRPYADLQKITPPFIDGQTINVSWMGEPEEWFPCKINESKRALYNLDGQLKRAFSDLPSGVRLYITRIGPRRYTFSAKHAPHIVRNCKFFVRDGSALKVEIRDQAVEWETAEDVFRHQLTFEDMDALYEEAQRINLSVRDAVHEVMRRYARTEPWHVRDVYDVVFFLLRTCSLAAVWAQFRVEHECYVRVSAGHYRFDPEGVFPMIRYLPSGPWRLGEPHLPPRPTIEEPLLRTIIGLGGSIAFSTQGRDIEISLATEFGLPDEVRNFAAPHYNSQGHRKWRNHLQFVRNDLVARGEID